MIRMTVQEAFFSLKSGLTSLYDAGEAASIADWVIEDITGKTKLERLVSGSELLSAKEQQRLSEAGAELMRYRPVQYVLGKSYFAGMELKVSEQVLIPRPETEELVEWAVQSTPEKKPDILDIGTGSGCIALALKKRLPAASVTAIDVSEAALSVARENAAKHNLEIRFAQLDFLDAGAQAELPAYDLIISNPPYITGSEKSSILPHVLNYEPHTALFVTDNDPLQFYKAIAGFAQDHLRPQGLIFCELHRDYAAAARAYFESCGWHSELRKDMQQQERMLCCHR